jgi:hypothetical protein
MSSIEQLEDAFDALKRDLKVVRALVALAKDKTAARLVLAAVLWDRAIRSKKAAP